ncbi:hypothetical protein CK203_011587 [Vitis vinifera]|uniref:Uncharacterized protein n=1 Tax=Vitis vinifera TaxID=29760 RepID=A0A438JUN4_VITVI|nr:hypothetical protein CK203_011587 [Vitis vinifera]
MLIKASLIMGKGITSSGGLKTQPIKCLVRWTLEYEKSNQRLLPPDAYLSLVSMSKDMDGLPSQGINRITARPISLTWSESILAWVLLGMGLPHV